MINYKIFDNINKIERKDWDEIFGDIPESYSFYKVLDNSQFSEFKFYYLVGYQEDKIIFIAPLFTADFNLDIAVEGWLAKVIGFIRKVFPRFVIFKTLFCGSPFAEHGALGIRQDAQVQPDLVKALLNGINDLTVKTGSRLVIFKDFLKQSTLFLDVLKKHGYSRVESFPAVSVDLNVASFEDYLKSLGKSTRKNLNKKLKQAFSRANLEIKEAGGVEGVIDRIFQLYEFTYNAGSTKFERLNRQFFLQVSRDPGLGARFFLYYVNGKLAAFNLCFVYPDLLIDKFIGFDYDISKRHNLYFVSWAHNIKWCIAKGLQYYYPGQTGYKAKISLGGRLITLYAYLRHKNAFFNFLLKLFIPFLKPDDFSGSIKKADV